MSYQVLEKHRRITSIACSFLLVFAGNISYAATDNKGVDPDGIDTVLGGFEQTPQGADKEQSVEQILDVFEESPAGGGSQENTNDSALSKDKHATERSAVDTKSLLLLSTVYNYAHEKPAIDTTDYRGLSRLRLKLQSELTLDMGAGWKSVVSGFLSYDAIYEIQGRDQYTNAVLDANEVEAEFLDTYLQGGLNKSTDIKLGRQIIAWGNSENIRVVDILNPLDLREPGMTDISNLRLPVTAVKIDHYHDPWDLSLIAIPEIRFNKLPTFGSEYYPARFPPPDEEQISNGGANTEYALALKGIFHGWDLSLHWADFYNDDAHHELLNGVLKRVHGRLKLTGATATGTSGNWLAKSELARISGLEFFSDPGKTYSRIDFLVGFEYAGLKDSLIALESAFRRIQDYQSELENGIDSIEQDSAQTLLRYTGNFDHDRLKLNVIGLFYGKDYNRGRFYRVTAQYELLNSMLATVGFVTYQAGDDVFFKSIEDNDRVFLDLAYNF